MRELNSSPGIEPVPLWWTHGVFTADCQGSPKGSDENGLLIHSWVPEEGVMKGLMPHEWERPELGLRGVLKKRDLWEKGGGKRFIWKIVHDLQGEEGPYA